MFAHPYIFEAKKDKNCKQKGTDETGRKKNLRQRKKERKKERKKGWINECINET